MDETKIKILYAEDDFVGAKLTKMILEKEGFEIKIATDGAKAWKIYLDWPAEIVLTDLEMGGNDGKEFIQKIRELNLPTHIIVYTSHGEPIQEVAVLDAGADEFINKERPPKVLISHMNRIREKILKNEYLPHIHALSPHTTYNSTTRELTIDGIITRLDKNLGRLLYLLIVKTYEVCNKSYLTQGVWGSLSGNKESEVKKYISLLRTELKGDPSLIIEHQDGGYILMVLAE